MEMTPRRKDDFNGALAFYIAQLQRLNYKLIRIVQSVPVLFFFPGPECSPGLFVRACSVMLSTKLQFILFYLCLKVTESGQNLSLTFTI